MGKMSENLEQKKLVREPKIIFEDEDLLFLNKPAGMVVNRAITTRGKLTIQDWVEKYIGWDWGNTEALKGSEDTEVYFKKRSGVVHRLDKDTSGVMVVAKNQHSFEKLKQQFKKREIKKVYLALVHGLLQPKQGTAVLPIARSKLNRTRFEVAAGGKIAKTSWKVIKVFKDVKLTNINKRSYQGFSLVEVYPLTGRTHQIRVHMAHFGHPVVGDAHYVGRKRAKLDQKWCRRQFLHALSIEVTKPNNIEQIVIKAPLAKDLKKTLEFLE